MSASVARIAGVASADLNFASATLLVTFDPQTDPREDVERVVASTGHSLVPMSGERAGVAPERSWIDRNMSEIAVVGSGGFSAAGFLLGFMGAGGAEIAAFAVAIVFGGLVVWRRALTSLRARILDMNVLMSIAVLGAAALGEWGEGATVFFLFCVGGLLESRSLARTRRSIRDLMDFAPAVATVRRIGEVVQIAADLVVVGDALLVRAGERIAADGVIVAGSAAIDESPVTGESVPADKGVGDTVFAGTLDRDGSLEISVTAAPGDSTLARIVRLVEEAQASRAPSQTFVERFSRIYTPFVIVLALFVAVLPPLVAFISGSPVVEWTEWVRRSLVVLVVSCPCALVISTPVSVVSGITRASRDGVLVKGGAFLEKAAGIRVAAFDKTGTLTEGHPEVCAVLPQPGVERAHVLSVAASLEAHSAHPLARAVVQAGHAEGMATESISAFREVAGAGVSGSIERPVPIAAAVLSPQAAEGAGLLGDLERATVAQVEDDGATALVVVEGDSVIGVVCVSDRVRPTALAAVSALRSVGIAHVVMLTGDNERVAHAVAEQSGVSEYRARALPEDKTAAVEELRAMYGPVVMVGDGVNDAPALAASDIGIAMGAAGSDIALETADVALMGDDIAQVARFLALGRRTMRTIKVNIGFSIAVKAVFLALALTGQASLWMAVFADTGVSLLVILNGMRLLRRV